LLVQSDQSDPRNLKAGDRVYTHYGNFVGEIETVDGLRYHLKYKAGSEYGYVWRMQSQLAGKIVPAADLRAGDEVLVKDADSLACNQRKYANMVLRVESLAYNYVYCKSISFFPDRFVGKLIRFKQTDAQTKPEPVKPAQPESKLLYKVGDTVCVAKSNVGGKPFIGKIDRVLKPVNGSADYLIDGFCCYASDVLGLAHPDQSKPYRKGDKLFMRKGYGHNKPFIGAVTGINPPNPAKQKVYMKEPNGSSFWQWDADIAGRAL
jgi:hypothetical protein